MTISSVPPMSPDRSVVAALAAASAAFLVWALLSLAAGSVDGGRFVVREAWDDTPYWLFGLPLVAVVVTIAGYVAPRRVWRWPLYAAAGQAVAMAFVHPPGTDLGLLPLAVIFIGLPLMIVMTVPALIAGTLARRGWSWELLL